MQSSSIQELPDIQKYLHWSNRWKHSCNAFKKYFTDNEFGYACDVCDRLWFRNSLTTVKDGVKDILSDFLLKFFDIELNTQALMMCYNCLQMIKQEKFPQMAKWNGFFYPVIPSNLPPLDLITERLIAPRLPFMQIRRLRQNLSYGITGQVINVPVDVQDMVHCLPRQLDNDFAINVCFKRNILHKSSFLNGFVKKEVVWSWLRFLESSTLYVENQIKIDWNRLNQLGQTSVPSSIFSNNTKDNDLIENLDLNSNANDLLMAKQHTVVWNENYCLSIAPGQFKVPLNLIYDKNAEELSFPGIYLGEPRKFRQDLKISPFTIATSEIRRKDRRSACYQKILYMALKIMRIRMVEGIKASFRSVEFTKNVTRKMLEDPTFLDEALKKNFAFMKSLPNSVQFWADKKNDLFAMIRQLGKPTVFLTLTANEVGWIELITILQRLCGKYIDVDVCKLTDTQKVDLVCHDPVTCCIYFKKKIDTIMNILQSPTKSNPFGNNSVTDYFARIEFQQRGSPHAHILLWLKDDPKEFISEAMPKTINLIEKLISIEKEDLPNGNIYNRQVHKHTFTCYKNEIKICRFGIPFWPSEETCILLPLAASDNRRKKLKEKAKTAHKSLETRTYTDMSDFFLDNDIISYDEYYDMIRSHIHRPIVLLKRSLNQCNTNPFHPWISGIMDSNMDI